MKLVLALFIGTTLIAATSFGVSALQGPEGFLAVKGAPDIFRGPNVDAALFAKSRLGVRHLISLDRSSKQGLTMGVPEFDHHPPPLDHSNAGESEALHAPRGPPPGGANVTPTSTTSTPSQRATTKNIDITRTSAARDRPGNDVQKTRVARSSTPGVGSTTTPVGGKDAKFIVNAIGVSAGAAVAAGGTAYAATTSIHQSVDALDADWGPGDIDLAGHHDAVSAAEAANNGPDMGISIKRADDGHMAVAAGEAIAETIGEYDTVEEMLQKLVN